MEKILSIFLAVVTFALINIFSVVGQDVPAIYGGQPVPLRSQYAYMARIEEAPYQDPTDRRIMAAGALITASAVLTSAMVGVYLGQDLSEFALAYLTLGDLSSSTIEGTEQTWNISYKDIVFKGYGLMDPAIIRLSPPAVLNDYVKPISLYPLPTSDISSYPIILAAWGSPVDFVENPDFGPVDQLTEFAEPMDGDHACNINKHDDCLSWEGGDSSACSYDYGTPITVAITAKRVLVGIYVGTYGYCEDAGDNLNFGTNIGYGDYYDWIMSVVSPPRVEPAATTTTAASRGNSKGYQQIASLIQNLMRG